MNRFVVLAIAGCVASAALSAPASADPILSPDPGLGIIGIGDPPDPQDVLNATPQMLTMGACSGAASGFYCGEYNFSSGDSTTLDSSTINSTDLSLWNAAGAPIAAADFTLLPESQFTGILTTGFGGADGHTVQLFAETSGEEIPVGDLLIFSDAPGFVSVRAVNDLPNPNAGLFPDDQPLVPEPTTLVLMGSGLVGLVTRGRRRLRGRTGNQPH